MSCQNRTILHSYRCRGSLSERLTVNSKLFSRQKPWKQWAREKKRDWNIVMYNDFYEFYYYFRKWFLSMALSLKWRVNSIDWNITSYVYVYKIPNENSFMQQKYSYLMYVGEITENCCCFTHTSLKNWACSCSLPAHGLLRCRRISAPKNHINGVCLFSFFGFKCSS